jgi:fructose-1,6-bisphosphatase II
MDRNFALEFVRVTEAAAFAASKWVGRGDKHAADGAAVDAMRKLLNNIEFTGTIVIGEGQKDEAPELYTGEKVGKGGAPHLDLAVDPLECTDSVAYGRYNALAVISAGAKGSLLSAPDTYMEKIAAGPGAGAVIDIDAPVKDNIKKVAKALGKDIDEITVIVLDRDRHQQLIADVRKAGARVRLITDGDVAGGIAPCIPDSGIDMLMGIGASAEAVLAATAIKSMGGEILCRFKPKDDKHAQLVADHGHNTKRIFSTKDLAKGTDLMFTATGVIDGPLLQGVRILRDTAITHSIVIRGESRTVRYITTHHALPAFEDSR